MQQSKPTAKADNPNISINADTPYNYANLRKGHNELLDKFSKPAITGFNKNQQVICIVLDKHAQTKQNICSLSSQLAVTRHSLSAFLRPVLINWLKWCALLRHLPGNLILSYGVCGSGNAHTGLTARESTPPIYIGNSQNLFNSVRKGLFNA